jgi:SSS family solute:Na+ symporter
MLIIFIALYMLFSIAIGLYSSMGVKNSNDYILAGRSIPLYMTITTVFATWFGSESVVGIPPVFINDGLRGVIAEPIGTGCCLIIVGVFYAARLYRMKLVTIGDFYRQRYSRLVELLVSVTICISYLGWMSAQIVALGLVIKLVFSDTISFELAMFIGLSIVMIYTIYGGMKSLVVMDFIQMISIVIGLISVAILVANRFDGGATAIIATAAVNNKFDFWPETNFHDTLKFIASFLTLALGSVPQQDVFQRIMAAKNERTAVLGTTIGGLFYIIFCFVPIFITYGISLMSPGIFERTLENGGDQQRILIDYIFNETPIFLQVLFFGALLSAIMSTASGTLLAPSALFAENILKESLKLTDRGIVLASRICVFVFGFLVYFYSYLNVSAGISILEIIKGAYLVTLCGAFVPLTFGVYWNGANNQGAITSIICGVGTWSILTIIEWDYIPPQLLGLAMSTFGMIFGSLFSRYWKKVKITIA